jgi:hypothetical protein
MYRIRSQSLGCVKTNIGSLSPFHQVEPVLFNTRDPKVHQRKKKIVSPAFSARGLQDFEPHMSRDIRKLINLINERVKTSEGTTKLDFNEYCALQLPFYRKRERQKADLSH